MAVGMTDEVSVSAQVSLQLNRQYTCYVILARVRATIITMLQPLVLHSYCMSLAFLTQHAKRTCRIVICGLFGFFTPSHRGKDFRSKVIQQKSVF